MAEFLEVIVGGLIGSGIATTLVGLAFLRRTKTIEAEITAHFDRSMKVFESERAWKQQALFELFGPIQMQLDRTNRAFSRWDKRNLHLEANVVRVGNMTIRDILLNKGHLIPPDLMKDAGQLIGHYDAWLEKFDSVRGDSQAGRDVDFVFTGPDGHPFPSNSEARFNEAFRKLQKELYGV